MTRYAIVGVASNILLYIGYLVLTSYGLGHKTAMTVLYAVGIVQTFVLNRRWTFNHKGSTPASFVRYVGTYVMGYLFQLGVLYFAVDLLGWPHQGVQGVLIFTVAGGIFLLQKFWVFTEARPPARDYAM